MTLLKFTPLSLLLLFACGPKDDLSDETTLETPATGQIATAESTGSSAGGDSTSQVVDPTTSSAEDPSMPPTSETGVDPGMTSSTTAVSGDTGDTGVTTMDTGDTGEAEQTPPQGHAAVEAWLAEGYYKDWHCEAALHAPIPISPHGKNRICSNDILSAHPVDGGEYPVGSAGVKELYDAGGASIIGYAVYLHTTAGTTGDTWYWYERVPLNSPAPHDGNGVVADGAGSSGPALNICVGCHQAAGVDADHPGHDFVYTQVQ